MFFVSDTHFHHDREFIYKPRGYNSVQEMDEGIIKIWNERVDVNDIVIHLGDFCFQADQKLAENYIQRLNGKIFLLWGNHNSGVKQLYQYLLQMKIGANIGELYPLVYDTGDPFSPLGKSKLTFCGNYMHGKIDHVMFCASHYAHRVWDAQSKGTIFVGGHSHGNDTESQPDWLDCKRLDVGIENFGGPIEFYELMKIMDKKKIGKYDHHDQNTTTSGF